MDGKLVIKGKEITDLYIAASDQQFYKAEIKNNKLIISTKEVKQPVAVRFGFTENYYTKFIQ